MQTMNVNKELAEKCVEYVINHYRMEDYLKEKGVWNGQSTGGKDIFMRCPFHSDSTPSFSVDVNAQKYRCFACNSRGNFFSLVTDYRNIKECEKVDYYKVMDETLKADRDMQEYVGSHTIFKVETLDIKSSDFVRTRKMPKIKPNDILPQSFLELSRRMQKDSKTSFDDIRSAILSMQEGMSVEHVYNMIYGIESGVSVNDTRYSTLFGGTNNLDEDELKFLLEGML